LPIFALVPIGPGSCSAPSGEQGNCIPSKDCALRNGIPAGPCGGGYGVCCICEFSPECGQQGEMFYLIHSFSSSDLRRCDTRELHLLCEPQPSGCLRWHRKLSGNCPKTPSGYLPAASGLGHVFDSTSRGSQSPVQPGSAADIRRQSHAHHLWQFDGRSQ